MQLNLLTYENKFFLSKLIILQKVWFNMCYASQL